MVLILVVAGAVIPSLVGTAASARLRSAARVLHNQCRYARDLSVRRQTPARVVIDVDQELSQVRYLDPQPEEGQDPEWLDATEGPGLVKHLPEGVGFGRMATTSPDGEPQVTFFPDGRGEDFFLTVQDHREHVLAVHVTATTGATEVLSDLDAERFESLDEAAEDVP